MSGWKMTRMIVAQKGRKCGKMSPLRVWATVTPSLLLPGLPHLSCRKSVDTGPSSAARLSSVKPGQLSFHVSLTLEAPTVETQFWWKSVSISMF